MRQLDFPANSLHEPCSFGAQGHSFGVALSSRSNYHLLSRTRQAFFGHLRATGVLPIHHLVRIILDKGYSARVRSAALRNLVGSAPLEVTLGQPYAVRRLLVRKHYQV